MKIFSALVGLLLISSVGCGQQDKAPASPPVENPVAATASPESAAPAATNAPLPQPQEAAPAGEPAGSVDEETPIQAEGEPSQNSVNKRLASALSSSGSGTSAAASSRWQEGTNYKRLIPAQPTDVAADKIEVVEVFWYGCTHCYALEPYLAKWQEKKPSYIQFVRVPVVWGLSHQAHARLFYTLQVLGRQDLHPAVFRETQVAGNALASNDEAQTEKLQAAFAQRHGIKEEDFRKAYRSFEVNTKVQRAQDLTRRYRVEGVPAIVINGKYTTDVGSAGNQSRLIELIDDLAAREHKKE